MLRKVARYSTLAAYLLLGASAGVWYWMADQPVARIDWRTPIVLVSFSLGCSTVGLIACRRTNLILLFLSNLACAMTGAWFLAHMRESLGLPGLLLVR